MFQFHVTHRRLRHRRQFTRCRVLVDGHDSEVMLIAIYTKKFQWAVVEGRL